MKFSMYARFSEILRQEGAEAAARRAVELGFTSVEPLDYYLEGKEPLIGSEEEARRLHDALSRHGLTTACYSVGINLWRAGMTPDTVTPAEEALLHHARMAAALGSPFLHHTFLIGVPPHVLTMDEVLTLLAPVAIRVAKYAHSLGLTCIYEGQGMYVNGVEGFGAFLAAVKRECPYVGVCGDIGNPLFVDEDPLLFFRAFAPEIRHVHLKDYLTVDAHEEKETPWTTRGGTLLRETVIGKGIIDYPACLSVLREVGYEGVFSLENNHPEDYETGVAEGMRLVRELLPA